LSRRKRFLISGTIRTIGTKRDISKNIGAFLLNVASAIGAIALTQNFPANIDSDSENDSFEENEPGHLPERKPPPCGGGLILSDSRIEHYFFRASAYG
jgi:hypothetical protein